MEERPWGAGLPAGLSSGWWGRWEVGIGARPNTREDLPAPLMDSHTHGSDKAPALGLGPGACRLEKGSRDQPQESRGLGTAVSSLAVWAG